MSTPDVFRALQPKGKDYSIKGDANEHRVVAALLDRGYNASLVDLKNSKYDVVIEIGRAEFLRLQVKTADGGSISLRGGGRGGRGAVHDPSVTSYQYTTDHCDCIVGVYSTHRNGDTIDFYFLPVSWAQNVDQTSISLRKLVKTKNNFLLLEKCRDEEYVDQCLKDVTVRRRKV